MNEGNATLVVDLDHGFSVVFIDRWGTVVHRTQPSRLLEETLMEAAAWFNAPICIELKMLKP